MDAVVNSGCGEQLKSTREKLGLSVEVVAKKLNLPVSRIKEIEAEQFGGTISPAFYRGYIKSYAQVLNLNVTDIVEKFNQLAIDDVELKAIRGLSASRSMSREVSTKSRGFKWTSFILIAVVISALVWSIKDKFNFFDGLKKSPQRAQIELTESAVTTPASEARTTRPLSSISSTSDDNSDRITDKSESAPELSIQPSNTKSTEGVSVASSETSNSAIIKPLSETTSLLSSQLETLQFVFVGDCWVEVTDATGEKIAYGIKPNGKVMTVQGVAPISITLGEPSVVTLRHNDKSVDLSAYRPGRSAVIIIESE